MRHGTQRPRSKSPGVLLAAALCLHTKHAQSEPIAIELSWEAPPECPSYVEVLAELNRIARAPTDRMMTTLHAQATIERVAGRYKLLLRTQREDHRGETELEASTCASLKRGATLVLALALGEGVAVGENESPTQVDPAEPTEVVMPAPDMRPEPFIEQDRSALRWSSWIAARGAAQFIGPSSWGADLGTAIEQRGWDAFVRASLWPAARMAKVETVQVRSEALTAALGACATVPIARWTLAGCAAFETGILRAWSVGAPQDDNAVAPWYAAVPSLVVRHSFARSLLFRLEAGVAVSLAPPVFAVHPVEIYRVARFVPTASIGFGIEP